MFLPGYIAKRYLLSKKTRNVINIISGVAIVGVAVGALALVVVLSAFNGLESLVEELYASFNPEIKVAPASGKFFNDKEFPYQFLSEKEGVASYSKVVQDIALIKLQDQQTIATIKGVDSNYQKVNGVDSMMYKGEFILKDKSNKYAIMGFGVAARIKYFGLSFNHPLVLYYPNNIKRVAFAPQNAFNTKPINLGGIFLINPDFDNKYVLTPLHFAQDLFGKKDAISAIELRLNSKVNVDNFQKKLQAELGKKFIVQKRNEQDALIYKTNKTEKLVTYFILTFILVIAAFNIIASLTMLIMDKSNDIWILKSMGASKSDIQSIFFLEGMLINLSGAIIGISLGLILCILQQQVGLLTLQGGIVDYYPIKIKLSDIFYIFMTVFVIGIFASWYPVRVLTKRYLAE